MKAHKNQWLLNPLPPLISLVEPQAEDKPWPLMCKHLRSPLTWNDPRNESLQLLESKALSQGIIGKSAPILAEITIRSIR
jgi:hypothetical protein